MLVTGPGDLFHRGDHSQHVRGVRNCYEPGRLRYRIFDRTAVRLVIAVDAYDIKPDPLP